MDARTVLVIEDDVSIRELVVELLDDAGFRVLQTERGDAGLHLAITHQPAVVLVNHVLPDMSGLDLLDDLRRRDDTCGIPVIMVSGRTREAMTATSKIDCLLPMPFDIDTLMMQVERFAMNSRNAAA